MPTDRTIAHALITGWIKHMRSGMDRAMQFHDSWDALGALEGSSEILDVLVRVPIQAETDAAEPDVLGDELATLVAVCGSQAKFSKSFTRLGKKALRARRAIANFTSHASEAYQAVLDLLAEMERLADMLRVQTWHSDGNVTHISAGPQDPELAAVALFARTAVRDFVAMMAKLMEAYEYTWADQALAEYGRIAGLTQRVRLIASVPYLARRREEVPDELAPLVQVYQRGGKPAKAIGRCANAAAVTLKGLQGGLYNNFHSARVEVHTGMQQLIPALEQLVQVIS